MNIYEQRDALLEYIKNESNRSSYVIHERDELIAAILKAARSK